MLDAAFRLSLLGGAPIKGRTHEAPEYSQILRKLCSAAPADGSRINILGYRE
jgi:hypothetical protein